MRVTIKCIRSGILSCLLLLLITNSTARAQQPELVAQVGQETAVKGIAFSPDGRLMVTAGNDAAVLWEVATGREIRRFLGRVVQLEPFSKDARYIMTAYEEYTGYGKNFSSGWFTRTTEHLFDTTTGHEIRFTAKDSKGYWAVAISPDNRLVVTGDHHNNIVRLWDVATGELLRQIPAFTRDPPGGIGFTKDGRYVLTTSGEDKDALTKLWDPSTGQLIRSFIGSILGEERDSRYLVTQVGEMGFLWDERSGKELARFDHASYAAFSLDGNIVALSDNATNKTRVFNILTAKELYVLEGKEPGFTPNGQMLMTSGEDSVHLWNLSDGSVVGDITATNAEFSPDGRYVITTKSFYEATDKRSPPSRLLDLATGAEVLRFDVYARGVQVAKFSPDGRYVATASDSETRVRLWDISAKQEAQQFEGKFTAGSFVVSPDERWVITQTSRAEVTTGPDGESIFEQRSFAQLWDLSIGQVVQKFDFKGRQVSFSPDGRFVIIDDGDSSLREVVSWREVRRFKGGEPVFSPDGRLVATSGKDKMYITEVESGRVVQSLMMRPSSYGEGQTTERIVQFSPNGLYGLTLANDSYLPIRLWSLKSGQEIGDGEEIPPNAVAFAPDGRTFLVGTTTFGDGGGGGDVCLRRVSDGKLEKCYEGMENAITNLSITKDNRFVLASSTGNVTVMWDKSTGRLLRRFVGGGAQLSADETLLLTADQNRARLWNFADGSELMSFEHSTGVGAVGFMHKSRITLTSSSDAALKLWDTRTGRELCRLVSSTNDEWVVISPGGLFDANNLDDIKGLHWVTSDAPFTTLPLEIFMREYYEPRLLSRLIKCNEEKNCDVEFKPIRDISKLNRVQQTVSISNVSEPDANGYVNVTIEVGKGVGKFQVGNLEETRTTGVYDVRLFRDGQMVGSWPGDGAEKLLQKRTTDSEPNHKPVAINSFQQDLRVWRQATEVVPNQPVTIDDRTGLMTLPSFRVKLPIGRDVANVEFSAYAFNEDRVKSQTAKWKWPRDVIAKLPKAQPIKPRAYVISVGVNAYENADFDLEFAADDARRMAEVVTQKLDATGQYETVTPVTLISDYKTIEGRRTVTEQQATKEKFHAVLDILAGRNFDQRLLAGVKNAEQLQKATPDDLVLIMYSSHGYADRAGNFYFIPYDTGPGKGKVFTETVRRHSISSDELSLWLRDVDAGEMIMIVDACHSTAAIEGSDFKPGPMGSRGLGQLSYDKGMKILTATQSDNVALENNLIKQGLLTYALVRDGIEARQADFKPRDNVINIREWLSYGVDRVPKLYEEVKTGKIQNFGITTGPQTKAVLAARVGESRRKSLDEVVIEAKTQQPSLFDFTRKRREVALVK